MYPIVRFTLTLLGARRRPKLALTGTSVLGFRVGLADTDMFGELNNARYFSFMELGRWDYSSRVGFVALMRRNRWGVAAGGASVRFRRRIPLFRKFTLTTRLLCHDGRWFYFLQEFHARDRICASALIKMGVTSRDGLVPAPEVLAHADGDLPEERVPDWVQAWIDAEGLRPWPRD